MTFKLSYSLDMIRLKVKIEDYIFVQFQKNYLDYNPNVLYYEKLKYNEYRYNWNIKETNLFGKEFSYWMGYKHNSQTNVNKSAGYLVIEFNPNKCTLTGLLDGILKTFYKYDNVIISSVDIAIDIDININTLIVDKYKKHVYKLFDNGGDNKTHYLGIGDGRIKIYNKARELGIDGDLTRYEISKKIDMYIKDVVSSGYSFDGEILPLSYMNDIDVKDKTLSAVYYSVLNGFPISELSRDYKSKIRDLLSKNSIIEFDKEKISSTICQWFEGYQEIYMKSFN